jgi:hypothetical protein
MSYTIPDLLSWDFNVLILEDKNTLNNCVLQIFHLLLKNINVQLNTEKLVSFINEVSNNYYENPFHNYQHAVCVTHTTYLLLIYTHMYTILKPHISLAILFAALLHDIRHPGNTNAYEINSRSKLALLYNDVSVLEQYHCSTGFEILYKSELLDNGFSQNELNEIRRTIILSILGTDMEKHESTVKLIDTLSRDMTIVENQYNMAKVLIHCADLSNPTRKFIQSYEWCRRIKQELYRQGMKEDILGITSAQGMKVKDLRTIAGNEILFILFIIKPLWIRMSALFTKLEFVNENIEYNLRKWRFIIDEINTSGNNPNWV